MAEAVSVWRIVLLNAFSSLSLSGVTLANSSGALTASGLGEGVRKEGGLIELPEVLDARMSADLLSTLKFGLVPFERGAERLADLDAERTEVLGEVICSSLKLNPSSCLLGAGTDRPVRRDDDLRDRVLPLSVGLNALLHTLEMN